MMKIKLYIGVLIVIFSLISGYIFINIITNNNFKTEKNIDSDEDGLTDNFELEIGTNPMDLDTDNDGIYDKDEYDYWMNKYNITYVDSHLPTGDVDKDNKINILDKDSDNDLLSDGYELNIGIDPADSDTDDDKLSDGDEINIGANPFDSDSDYDGVIDGSDINPLIDLSFSIKINKIRVIKRVDILPWAQIYFEIRINEEKFIINNEGKFWWVVLNLEKEISRDVISFDISDNTNDLYTEIEIIMYDKDFFGNDDIIDISDLSGQDTLIMHLNHKTNTISSEGNITEGSKGVLFYEVELPEKNSTNINSYKISYQWSFKGHQWDLSLEIPVNTYMNYLNSNISRVPQIQFQSNKKMGAFVTSNEMVIIDLKNKLKFLIEGKNYDRVTIANFILKFVQTTIEYSLDNISKGCVEYWRFPIETLVEKEGDCEDTSVLYASILDAFDYDIVLLFYTWNEGDEKIGHLSVGIQLDGEYGEYIEYNNEKYFYCETTNNGYSIGQIPPEIKSDPIKIINI